MLSQMFILKLNCTNCTCSVKLGDAIFTLVLENSMWLLCKNTINFKALLVMVVFHISSSWYPESVIFSGYRYLDDSCRWSPKHTCTCIQADTHSYNCTHNHIYSVRELSFYLHSSKYELSPSNPLGTLINHRLQDKKLWPKCVCSQSHTLNSSIYTIRWF